MYRPDWTIVDEVRNLTNQLTPRISATEGNIKCLRLQMYTDVCTGHFQGIFCVLRVLIGEVSVATQ